MNKFKIIFPSALLLLIAAMILHGCGDGSGETTDQKIEKKIPIVKVKQIESSVFSDNFKVVGLIKRLPVQKYLPKKAG